MQLLRIFSHTILLVLLLFFTGCAVSNVKSDFALSPDKSTGLIIGSITQSKGPETWQANGVYYYEGKENGYIETRVKSLPGFAIYSKSEFTDEDGRLFVIELPEGDYSFHTWKVKLNAYDYIYPRENPYPLQFSVGNGEIIYIGNLHLALLTGKDFFGMNITVGAYSEIRDKYERDVSIFKDRYEKLQNIKISKALLTQGSWYAGDGDVYRKHNPAPIVPP